MTRITQNGLDKLIQDITSLRSLSQYEGCYTAHHEMRGSTIETPDYESIERYNDRSSFDIATPGDIRFMKTETVLVDSVIYDFDLSTILQKSGYDTFVFKQLFPESINATGCDTDLTKYFQQALPEERKTLIADFLLLIEQDKLHTHENGYSLEECRVLFEQVPLSRLIQVKRATNSPYYEELIYQLNPAVGITRQEREKQETFIKQRANDVIIEEDKAAFKAAVLACYDRDSDILTFNQLKRHLSLFTPEERQRIHNGTSDFSKGDLIFPHSMRVWQSKRLRVETGAACSSTDSLEPLHTPRRQISPDIASYFDGIDIDKLTGEEFRFNQLMAEKKEFQRKNPGKLTSKFLTGPWNHIKETELARLKKGKGWKEGQFPLGKMKEEVVKSKSSAKVPRRR